MEKVIDLRMNMKEVSRFSVVKEVALGYLSIKEASKFYQLFKDG